MADLLEGESLLSRVAWMPPGDGKTARRGLALPILSCGAGSFVDNILVGGLGRMRIALGPAGGRHGSQFLAAVPRHRDARLLGAFVRPGSRRRVLPFFPLERNHRRGRIPRDNTLHRRHANVSIRPAQIDDIESE